MPQKPVTPHKPQTGKLRPGGEGTWQSLGEGRQGALGPAKLGPQVCKETADYLLRLSALCKPGKIISQAAPYLPPEGRGAPPVAGARTPGSRCNSSLCSLDTRAETRKEQDTAQRAAGRPGCPLPRACGDLAHGATMQRSPQLQAASLMAAGRTSPQSPLPACLLILPASRRKGGLYRTGPRTREMWLRSHTLREAPLGSSSQLQLPEAAAAGSKSPGRGSHPGPSCPQNSGRHLGTSVAVTTAVILAPSGWGQGSCSAPTAPRTPSKE